MKKKPTKRRNTKSRQDPNQYPKGWNRRRVEALAKYYDDQSDEQGAAELEAAFVNADFALMTVPIKLVPQVHKLLARRAG